MRIRHFAVTTLSTLLLLNSQLMAEETTEITIEEHVPFGSRPLDPAIQAHMRAILSEQSTEEEPKEEGLFQSAKAIIHDSGNEFQLAPATMMAPSIIKAYQAFPVNCHWLTSICDDFSSIEMEDGTHWWVNQMDSGLLANWRREDSLVIAPNNSWFSSFTYKVINKSTNTSVRVNPRMGPARYGTFSHWIANIDYSRGHVLSENQMTWCINPRDSYIISNWQVNDHLIFGINESWFSPYDRILINVQANTFVRAKLY